MLWVSFNKYSVISFIANIAKFTYLHYVLFFSSCSNYVVQHLLSLKMPRITDNLVRELERQFVYLACNKYGSNVVEKFIQDSGELQSARVILELLADPNVARLLVDPYGNYVIQSALTASKVSLLEFTGFS